VKHRKDYVDMHRTTEQERDTIEHEVSSNPTTLHSLCFTFSCMWTDVFYSIELVARYFFVETVDYCMTHILECLRFGFVLHCNSYGSRSIQQNDF
jgi:uncharacterized membrane protein (GlpM family)